MTSPVLGPDGHPAAMFAVLSSRALHPSHGGKVSVLMIDLLDSIYLLQGRPDSGRWRQLAAWRAWMHAGFCANPLRGSPSGLPAVPPEAHPEEPKHVSEAVERIRAEIDHARSVADDIEERNGH